MIPTEGNLYRLITPLISEVPDSFYYDPETLLVFVSQVELDRTVSANIDELTSFRLFEFKFMCTRGLVRFVYMGHQLPSDLFIDSVTNARMSGSWFQEV